MFSKIFMHAVYMESSKAKLQAYCDLLNYRSAAAY